MSPPGDLHERILAALRDSKKPLTLKALAKLVKAKDEPVRAALDSSLHANRLYRWPDFRRSQYFWHVSPAEQARATILGVASARALSKADLSKAAAKDLPGFPVKSVEAEVAALLAEKQLQTVPAFAGSSKLFVRPGGADAYFNAARSFVERKIRAAGFDPAAFFKGTSGANERPAAALILDAVRSLEPVRGVPVSTLRLRNHLRSLTKEEFDTAALVLRKQQAVFLSQHADPHNISQEDRNLLIDGQDGTYYVAIAIR